MKFQRTLALILVLLSGTLFTSKAWAKCANSVDPDKVILFLNINQSYNEISGVADAACPISRAPS